MFSLSLIGPDHVAKRVGLQDRRSAGMAGAALAGLP